MAVDLQLAQNYFIIGATGGIGTSVARQLRQDGHRVFLASPGGERLQQLAEELDSPYFECNATSFADVDKCFAAAEEAYEQIDGAVNCVGSILLKPAHMTREAEWHETLATNLTSAFATVRAASKTMTARGGSLVLVSSSAARIGLANHEAISAAKAGIIGLTQSAAASYAGYGLRFNAVAPGLVKTKLTEKIWKSERAAASSTSMHALGRLGEPEEVASLVVWLLNPRNSWITGEVISVDGGLSKVRLKLQFRLR